MSHHITTFIWLHTYLARQYLVFHKSFYPYKCKQRTRTDTHLRSNRRWVVNNIPFINYQCSFVISFSEYHYLRCTFKLYCKYFMWHQEWKTSVSLKTYVHVWEYKRHKYMCVMYTHTCVCGDVHICTQWTYKQEEFNKLQTRNKQLSGNYFYLVHRREFCIVNDNFVIFFIKQTKRLSMFPWREHNHKLRKSFLFIKKQNRMLNGSPE